MKPSGSAVTREDERGRLLARLERSEALLRDVLERTADAIVVVDVLGVVRFANAAAEELFGKPRDQLVSAPFGSPLVTGETTELDLARPDGATRLAEMRVVESEWEGEPARVASLRDITDRREAERNARRLIREQAARAAAEASAARMRFLADAGAALSSSLDYRVTLAALARTCVPELADWAVVYVVDREGRVGRLELAHRDAERAADLRTLRDQPVDPRGPHPVLEVLRTREPLLERNVTPERLRALAQDEAHLAAMEALGVTSYLLVPLVARDRAVGALGLIATDATRTYGEDDLAFAEEVAGRAALAVDNARLYHEAREANRAKSDLLAVISHDLRTPLSSIIGYADLLCMGVPEPLGEASRHQVERIRTATRHLLYLIEELLAFARLDAGKASLELQDIRVEAVVREVAQVVEPLAQGRGLEFRLLCEPGAGRIRTDPGKLRQILMNLAGNAVKFTEKGEVRLEARGVDGSVELVVADTGMGIEPEHLEQIFQPFWQVRRSDPARAGTGLGLSVVRRLTTLLGGQVSVRSTPGAGTAFTVSLPRLPMAAADNG